MWSVVMIPHILRGRIFWGWLASGLVKRTIYLTIPVFDREFFFSLPGGGNGFT